MAERTFQSVTVRTSAAVLVFSMVALVAIAGPTLFIAGLAVLLALEGKAGLGIFLSGLAGFMAWLWLYCFRDLRGKWGWKVEISPTRLDASLPSQRSLIHHEPAVHRSFEVNDIKRIETRLEGYRTMGIGNMQRAFVMRLVSGEAIFLGEDRAVGTGLESSLVAKTAAAIREHYDVPLVDLGMAEGKGGFLAVLFAAPPDWDAPAMSVDAQAKMWRRVQFTGAVVGLAPLIVLMAIAFSGL